MWEFVDIFAQTGASKTIVTHLDTTWNGRPEATSPLRSIISTCNAAKKGHKRFHTATQKSGTSESKEKEALRPPSIYSPTHRVHLRFFLGGPQVEAHPHHGGILGSLHDSRRRTRSETVRKDGWKGNTEGQP